MPQMKPMYWLYFYLLFSAYIIMINILNFFLKININKMNNIKKEKMNKSINWKW